MQRLDLTSKVQTFDAAECPGVFQVQKSVILDVLAHKLFHFFQK